MALAIAAVIASAGASTGASAGCVRGAAPPVVPIEAPAEVVAAAKGTIEQWRQAYEVRSLEALGKLYLQELDLAVVQEGTALLGWSAVEAMLKDRLERAGAIHVRLRDVQVVSLGPGVASAVATMSRELVSGTTTITEQGALSLVLRQRAGGWVIAAEHYSYRRP